MKTVISASRSTIVTATAANLELVIDTGVKVTTTGPAIDAGGSALGRTITVNGTATAGAGPVLFYGDATFARAGGVLSIGDTGTLSGKGIGIQALSVGLVVDNRGTIATSGTGVDVTGADTNLTNSGLIASTAGLAVSLAGDRVLYTNHGTAQAAGNAVLQTGNGGITTNNGEINSTAASALIALGNGRILTNNGTINALDRGFALIGDDTTVTNNGTLNATNGAGIAIVSERAIITNTGTLNAGERGIALVGSGGVITNNGSIYADNYAISADGNDLTAVNTQWIQSGGGIRLSGNNANIVNYGAIEATAAGGAAVDLSAAVSGSLNNLGTLTAQNLAVFGGAGVQTVFNTGTINGNVMLGDGNDYFDTRLGHVSGIVSGEGGDDVYVIDDAGIRLVEQVGGGTDLVQSMVTLTLADNFENVTLIGDASVSAIGNALANQMIGNNGDNWLVGGAGNDVLSGLGGNDTLVGGDGSDTFVFVSGGGFDIVQDFTPRGAGHDVVDLHGLAGTSGYTDLVTNHLRQVGADVYLTNFGADTLVLQNVTLADLSAADFIF